MFLTRIHWLIPSLPCACQQCRSKSDVYRAGAACTSLQPHLSSGEGRLSGAYLTLPGWQQHPSTAFWPSCPSSVSQRHHWCVMRSTQQDSAPASSFSLFHSKITAKTHNRDLSLLQRVIEIQEALHLFPPMEILCLPCVI